MAQTYKSSAVSTPLNKYISRRCKAVITLKSGKVLKGLINRAGWGVYEGTTEDGEKIKFKWFDVDSHQRKPTLSREQSSRIASVMANYIRNGKDVSLVLDSGERIVGEVSRITKGTYQGATEDGKPITFQTRDIASYSAERRPGIYTGPGTPPVIPVSGATSAKREHTYFVNQEEGRHVEAIVHTPEGEKALVGLLTKPKRFYAKVGDMEFLIRDLKDIRLTTDLRFCADHRSSVETIVKSLPPKIQGKSYDAINQVIAGHTTPPKEGWAIPFTASDLRRRIQAKIGQEIGPSHAGNLLSSLVREGLLHRRDILSPRPHLKGGKPIAEPGRIDFYSTDLTALEAMRGYYDSPENQLKLVLRRTVQSEFGRHDTQSYLPAEWIHETLFPMLRDGATVFHLSKAMIDGHKGNLLQHMRTLFSEGKARQAAELASENAQLNYFTQHRVVHSLSGLLPGSEVWVGMDLLHTEKGANPNPESANRIRTVKWYCLNTPESIKSMRERMSAVVEGYKREKEGQALLADRVRMDRADSRQYKKERRIRL